MIYDPDHSFEIIYLDESLIPGAYNIVGTDLNPPPYYTHYIYHQDLCNSFVGRVTIDNINDPNTTFNHFIDE